MDKQTVNGIGLAYVDRGAGLPLVLVHGFPVDHAMWRFQIEALSKRHRVIAPDLRGFGQSDVTEGEVTMEQFADDLAGLLEALRIDEPIVLCGLSMGGYIAFAFWRKYAARLGALILCDTRAAADTPETAAGRRSLAENVVMEGMAPVAETMAPRIFAESTFQEQPALIEAIRRKVLAADPRAVAATSRGMALRPDMTGRLGEISCPTLVIVGRHDAISPPDEMRSIAERIPVARFVEISNAGHLSPLENPTDVNAAMEDFL